MVRHGVMGEGRKTQRDRGTHGGIREKEPFGRTEKLLMKKEDPRTNQEKRRRTREYVTGDERERERERETDRKQR